MISENNIVAFNKSQSLDQQQLDETAELLCLQQRFTVSYDYPICFSDNIFAPENLCLVNTLCRKEGKRRQRLYMLLDEGLVKAQPRLIEQIEGYMQAHKQQLEMVTAPRVIEAGEACKNDVGIVRELQQTLQKYHIDRQSHVVAMGGGALLDMVGYVAATTHRGVRLTRLPSTVLAQNDSGIGVKNGVNAFDSKNFLGCFAPPFAVINDLQLIASLGPRDKRAGLAEAIKVALIRDADFFFWLEQQKAPLADFELATMGAMIRRCAALHSKHITQGGDPFETSNARPLDFGHWAAHKLEALSAYELRHGEAVAIGLALDCRYAVEIGLLNETTQLRIQTLLIDLGFRLWHPVLMQRDLLFAGLQEFRQHLGGDLCITLIRDIGLAIDMHRMDHVAIGRALDWLRMRHRAI